MKTQNYGIYIKGKILKICFMLYFIICVMFLFPIKTSLDYTERPHKIVKIQNIILTCCHFLRQTTANCTLKSMISGSVPTEQQQ